MPLLIRQAHWNPVVPNHFVPMDTFESLWDRGGGGHQPINLAHYSLEWSKHCSCCTNQPFCKLTLPQAKQAYKGWQHFAHHKLLGRKGFEMNKMLPLLHRLAQLWQAPKTLGGHHGSHQYHSVNHCPYLSAYSIFWDGKNESVNFLTKETHPAILLAAVKLWPFRLYEKWFDSGWIFYRL